MPKRNDNSKWQTILSWTFLLAMYVYHKYIPKSLYVSQFLNLSQNFKRMLKYTKHTQIQDKDYTYLLQPD